MTATELVVGGFFYLISCILAFFIAKALTAFFKRKILRWIVVFFCTILSVPFLIIVFTIVMSENKKNGKY